MICGVCKERNVAVAHVRSCAAPVMAAAAPAAAADLLSIPTDSGIYRNPLTEEIFKVYLNQEKTRLLAKKLVLHPGTDATWDYAGLASRFVVAGWKMTLDDAKAFGAIYGVCCVCGATLTDEKSIAAGIGPICGKKWF